MTLGTLFWYKAGEPTFSMSQLLERAEQLGMDAPVRQILPIDVFRRLSGPAGSSAVYRVGNREVVLALRKAKETKTMLTRVVTRSLSEHGRVVERSEVADFVFYAPPRGEVERSRIRATLRDVKDLPDKSNVEKFAQALRDEYKRGLEFLDAQGVRRLVRANLAAHHALSIDGMYFVPDERPTAQLIDLLAGIGNCRGHRVVVADMPEHRLMIATALLSAARRAQVTPQMLSRYEWIESAVPEVRALVEEAHE